MSDSKTQGGTIREGIKLNLGGEEFKTEVTAEYFTKGKIAKKAEPLRDAINEAHNMIDRVALQQVRAVMLVFKAMKATGYGMTQKEMGKAIGCDQSWVSRSFSWYNNAKKETAHVLTDADLGKDGDKSYPVTDPDSFIRLIQAGATRSILDQYYKRESSGTSGKVKTAEEQVAGSIRRALKKARESGNTEVKEIDGDQAKALASQIIGGTADLSATIDHAVQASEATNPADRLEAWVELTKKVLGSLSATPEGTWKRGQIYAAFDTAGEAVEAFGNYIEEHGLKRPDVPAKDEEKESEEQAA